MSRLDQFLHHLCGKFLPNVECESSLNSMDTENYKRFFQFIQKLSRFVSFAYSYFFLFCTCKDRDRWLEIWLLRLNLEFRIIIFLTEKNLETKTSYITAKALFVSYCREVIKRVSWKYTLKPIEISQLFCFRNIIKSNHWEISSLDLFLMLCICL